MAESADAASDLSTTSAAPVLRVGTLMVADALALVASGLVAYFVWARPVHGQAIALYAAVAPGVLVFLLAFWLAGLYPGFGIGPVETLRRYWLVTVGVAVALSATTFAFKVPHVYSRMTAGIALLSALALLPAARWTMLRTARRWRWWPEPAIVVGTDAGIRRASELLTQRPALGFRVAGCITLAEPGSDGAVGPAEQLHGLPANALRGVRIAVLDARNADAGATMDALRQYFPRVVILRDFEQLPVEGVQVRNLGGVLGIEYSNDLLRWRRRALKRGTDVVLGGAGLIVSAPLIVAGVVAVKLLSRGPAFFWQERAGHHGRTIRVPKIRTMVPDADARLEEHLAQDPALREEWANGFKLRNDPRIIPVVGRLFRRFSIDELPQLWSVVRGDMSLVGPRPFPHYHLDALSASSRRLRAQVRPGLTGLWQVTARGVADIREQEGYDVYYIRNWSPWLDLYILAKTFRAVVSGEGAY